MQLEIRGHNLPGRAWQVEGEACDNIHVGVQIGREPGELVPGDRESARWSVAIDLVRKDGELDFRGPAVQGRRGERFVYLTWGNVGADGSFAMFQRAKLMFADLEPLLGSDAEQRIVATVDLTDECGGPRCARLRPPALALTTAT